MLAVMTSCTTIKKNINSNYKAKSEKRFQDKEKKTAENDGASRKKEYPGKTKSSHG
jgi:hypothetical protein